MAFQFGTYTFPMNPTSYSVPAVKPISLGYSVDGTLIGSTPLYNKNELTVSFENVTDDMNGIVSFIKSMIAQCIIDNRNNQGMKTFSDNIGIWSGNATLMSASCNINKIGDNYAYTFVLTFKLN